MSILIVAPNPAWVPPLKDLLNARDQNVAVAADAAAGLAFIERETCKAVIVDWHLPDMDCVQFCERVRSASSDDRPVVVVGPGDQLQNKLAAFDAGCDDFVSQPFESQEMVARLRAIMRRSNTRNIIHKVLQVHDLKYNTSTCEVFRANQLIRLGPICRKLLEVLLIESPKVVTRDRLERAIWGNAVPERDLLRSHISMLRKAVDSGQAERLIHTVHGTGFRLVAPTTN